MIPRCPRHTKADLPGPADVDTDPAGASPFGVMDMTGNVWQWTDEYLDEQKRGDRAPAVIISRKDLCGISCSLTN
jgi:formylglycine-generating enzyme required for sulfatase activity